MSMISGTLTWLIYHHRGVLDVIPQLDLTISQENQVCVTAVRLHGTFPALPSFTAYVKIRPDALHACNMLGCDNVKSTTNHC